MPKRRVQLLFSFWRRQQGTKSIYFQPKLCRLKQTFTNEKTTKIAADIDISLGQVNTNKTTILKSLTLARLYKRECDTTCSVLSVKRDTTSEMKVAKNLSGVLALTWIWWGWGVDCVSSRNKDKIGSRSPLSLVGGNDDVWKGRFFDSAPIGGGDRKVSNKKCVKMGVQVLSFFGIFSNIDFLTHTPAINQNRYTTIRTSGYWARCGFDKGW